MDYAGSREELNAKIAEYRQQLGLVLDALQKDPENEELNVLRRDLAEVISLTTDLLKYKESEDGLIDEQDEREDGAQDESIYLGKTCVVLYNGKQKYGVVVQVKGNEPTDLIIIELLGTKERCSLALKDLKLLEPPDNSLCPPGAFVQALYEDGRWYDCSIIRQTSAGYVVTYKDYNTSEEVRGDRIRVKKKMENKKETKDIVTPAGYVIPENLIIKKTDNEKEKMRKKRLVQSLKKQQKDERLHAEATKRADSWRKFQEKSGSRNRSGYMSGKRESSIFSKEDEETTAKNIANSIYNNIPKRKFEFTPDMF